MSPSMKFLISEEDKSLETALVKKERKAKVPRSHLMYLLT